MTHTTTRRTGLLRNTLAAMAMIGAAGAATSASAEELTLSTSWAFETEYVFRGVQFSETSFQPDVSLGYGGFYLGAWAALPVGDDDVAFGDEIDVYGGYDFGLTDLVSGGVGFTYYTFPDASSGFFDTLDEDEGTGANTFEIFATFGFDTFLAPSATVYYDFMFGTVTLEGGIGHSIPLAEALSLDFGTTIGHVFDDDDGGDYTYYQATADVSYAFTDSVSGAIGARYGMSSEDTFFDDINNGTFQDNSFWFGASLSAGF